jgi:arabinogalactan endo-1,4-beta-galactosidase
MLLMYIPIMYRTVYRIVFEKVTRAKESMRIMGMTDLPYWASWFVTYSTINTLLVLGAWVVLIINVFTR